MGADAAAKDVDDYLDVLEWEMAARSTLMEMYHHDVLGDALLESLEASIDRASVVAEQVEE